MDSQYYGAHTDYGGTISDTPVIPITTRHADDMLEIGASSFPVAAVVTANTTRNLSQVSEETSTEVISLDKVYEEVVEPETTPVYLPLSRLEFQNAVSGQTEGTRLPQPVVEEFYDSVLHTVEDTAEKYGRVILVPYSDLDDKMEELEVSSAELVSPDPELQKEFESKTRSYELFREVGAEAIPGFVARNPEEAVTRLDEIETDHVYVAEPEGGGGYSSARIEDENAFWEKFGDHEGELLVTEWVPQERIEAVPGVQLAVSGNDVAVLGVSDQIIENETEWKGNRFPGRLGAEDIDEKIWDQIVDESEEIGERMAEEGYRGHAGIDGMVYDGDFHPIEINPRMTGSTAVHLKHLDSTLEGDTPPAFYQEVESITGERDGFDGVFDPDEQEPWTLYVETRWISDRLRMNSIPDEIIGLDYLTETPYLANVPLIDATVPAELLTEPESSGYPTFAELGRAVVGNDRNHRYQERLNNSVEKIDIQV